MKGSQGGLLSPSGFGTRNEKTEKGGGDLAEELFREATGGRGVTTALEAINREPQLNWMSAPARALLAVALADGRPLRVITVVDDAAILVHAEHAIRCEGDPTARRARPCTDHVDRRADAARDRQIRCRALRRLRRARRAPDGVRGPGRALAHARAGRQGRDRVVRAQGGAARHHVEQLVDAFPQDDVAPAELVDDPGAGVLVGRCHECNGAVHAGAATIAIGWPVRKPVWKTFTPSLARTDKHDAALTRAPAKNSKLHALLAGELQMLCSPCAMNWKYGGIAMRPPAAPIEEGTLKTLVAEPTATLLHHPEPRAQVARAAVPEGGPEVVGGLIDREKTITTAIRALNVDHRRLAAVRSAVAFVNDDAELRYRILAIAWQLDRPLRIQTTADDAVRLEELVDLALRGGSVERALERT